MKKLNIFLEAVFITAILFSCNQPKEKSAAQKEYDSIKLVNQAKIDSINIELIKLSGKK